MSVMLSELANQAAIFDRPGREWTLDERWRVKALLYERPVLRVLLTHCLMHLGWPSTRTDAEDAWSKCAHDGRLDALIDKFDPTRVPDKPGWVVFRNLLLTDLARACWREGDRIRRGQSRDLPASESTDDAPIIIVDPGRPTDDRLVQRQLLLWCLAKALRSDRRILILRYIDNRSNPEIAGILAISVRAVEQRLYLARLNLKRCLGISQ